MRSVWISLLCYGMMLFGVVLSAGCKPSQSVLPHADAGQPSRESTVSLKTPSVSPASLPQRRVAFQDNTNANPDELGLLTTLLDNIQKLYQQSYQGGRIRDWSAYLEAQKMLKQAATMEKNISAQIRKQSPALVAQLQQTMQGFQQHISKKSHPQRLRLLSYKLMYRTQQIDPKLQTHYLNEYKHTLQKLQEDFAAYQQVGPYRVGLIVRKPRNYFRWKEINFSDRSHTITPERRSRMMLVVHLFDAQTGVPLAGTDVSVELIDVRSKKQILSQQMDQVWDGMSMYVHNLAIPPKHTKVWVQISISPFPLTRTQRTLGQLMQRAEARFSATIQAGQLMFPATEKRPLPPIAPQLVGTDVLRAITAVGGTIQETPLHRVGVALVPTETVWEWKGGIPVASKPKAFFNTQIIAFVQDKKTGLLVPDARIQFFYEWMTTKGKYEFQRYLKPVYDGFPGYRTIIRMKPTNYNLRLRIDTPLSGSFTKIKYPSYSVEIKDFRPPLQ